MLLGGAASYTASQWLIDRIGWRWSFAVFALLGVGWAVSFYLWFRDDPAEHPGQTNDIRRAVPDRPKVEWIERAAQRRTSTVRSPGTESPAVRISGS